MTPSPAACAEDGIEPLANPTANPTANPFTGLIFSHREAKSEGGADSGIPILGMMSLLNARAHPHHCEILEPATMPCRCKQRKKSVKSARETGWIRTLAPGNDWALIDTDRRLDDLLNLCTAACSIAKIDYL